LIVVIDGFNAHSGLTRYRWGAIFTTINAETAEHAEKEVCGSGRSASIVVIGYFRARWRLDAL
jgi:hypothetical protein